MGNQQAIIRKAMKKCIKKNSYSGIWDPPQQSASSSRLRTQSWSALEYRLEETSLPLIDGIKILHSSEGYGWGDLAAAITQESPHTIEHRPISSIWIAMALTPADIQRNTQEASFAGLLDPQALVITPPGEVVVDTIDNNPRMLHLFLKDSVLREVAEDIYDSGKVEFRYKASFGATDPILSQLMRATKQMLLEGIYQDWRSEYLARAIGSHILQRHCVLDSKRPPHADVRLSASQLKKVEEYMRSHLERPFTFGELAAYVGLSRTALFQRFTRTLHLTPHQYRQNLRVAQAKALIKNGEMTLSEVASACGFSDQTHMNRTFRQQLGLTPGQYRRDIE